jgi:hypothetical protein
MHFATLIPCWNSLDSVRRAHRDLGATALAFFALLVLFDVLAHLSKDESRKALIEKIGLCFFAVAVFAEIVAYPYGQRNDALSGQMIISLDAQAHEAALNASRALADSGSALDAAARAKNEADAARLKAAAVSKKAGQIDASLAAVRWVVSARRVQDEAGLETDLRREFKGTYIVFDSYVGDEESYWLCAQLASIARKAGVDSRDECAAKPLSKQLPITDLHISAPSIVEAERLSMILKKPGRVPGIFVGLNQASHVTVTVGVKPSVPLLRQATAARGKATR